MDAHAGTYEVKHLGKSMFRGEDGVAIFTNGNWVSVGSGLSAASSRTVTGTDAGLGDFSALEVSWTDGTDTSTSSPLLVTSAKSYKDGRAIVFEYTLPRGAAGTSLVQHANATRDEVIVNFPAFTHTDESLDGLVGLEETGCDVGCGAVHGGKGRERYQWRRRR